MNGSIDRWIDEMQIWVRTLDPDSLGPVHCANVQKNHEEPEEEQHPTFSTETSITPTSMRELDWLWRVPWSIERLVLL